MSTLKCNKEFFFQEEQEWEQVDPLLRRQIHGYDGKLIDIFSPMRANFLE